MTKLLALLNCATFVVLCVVAGLYREHRTVDRAERRTSDATIAFWRGLAIQRVVTRANTEVREQRTQWRRDSVDLQLGAQTWRVPGSLAQHIERYNRRDGERVTALLASRDDMTVHLKADSAGRP